MPGLQRQVAFHQCPCHQRYLLWIEIRCGILMGKVNAIVAGGVIPATVNVDKTRLTIWKRKMAVSAIDQAARPLPLKVVENIRKRASLEQIVFNFEWAGPHTAGLRLCREGIVSRLFPRRKISSPADPLVPRIDLPRWLYLATENRLDCIRIDQRKFLRMVRLRARDNRLLWRLCLVANVIYKNLQLRKAGRRKEPAQVGNK